MNRLIYRTKKKWISYYAIFRYIPEVSLRYDNNKSVQNRYQRLGAEEKEPNQTETVWFQRSWGEFLSLFITVPQQTVASHTWYVACVHHTLSKVSVNTPRPTLCLIWRESVAGGQQDDLLSQTAERGELSFSKRSRCWQRWNSQLAQRKLVWDSSQRSRMLQRPWPFCVHCWMRSFPKQKNLHFKMIIPIIIWKAELQICAGCKMRINKALEGWYGNEYNELLGE